MLDRSWVDVVTENYKINIYLTGGTIGADKYLDPKNPPLNASFSGGMEGSKKQLEKAILSAGFAGNTKLVCGNICAEDSKDLIGDKKYYLEDLIKRINDSKDKKFLVTCGTDAMREIALEIQKGLNKKACKTVVVTGAMTPISNGETSDGYKNVKDSFSALSNKDMNPGVYICMNGKTLRPISCFKDFTEGAFKEFNPKNPISSQRDNLAKRESMGLHI